MTATSPGSTYQTDWTPVLMGEALLFGLLGKLLYSNPAREWLEPLAADNLFDEAPFAGEQESMQRGLELLQDWAAALARDGLSEAALRDLKVDYARLLVGQRRMMVPAWESVYFSQERLTFQEETLDVRRWFARFGVEPSTDGKEPEDHIAFEMSFIAHLSEQGVAALEDEDEDQLAELLAAQREFLANHLLRWGWKWAELAVDYAQTDFYRGLALLVHGGLLELARIYDVAIPWDVKFPGLAE
ncbi:MAG: molecular chaperone TorD family protein [Anaerolineae bacterium]|nr:molecular chaperone TorD family protein [Anaerolineae bacterium]